MTYENPDVEIAALRAELAKANCTIADLRHLVKAHGIRGTNSARASLKSFRERLAQTLGSLLSHEELHFVELAFDVIDVHHGDVVRVLAAEKCACDETDVDQVLAQARAAQEKAEQLERGFLDATDPHRPRGKILNLGSRLKPARVYTQEPGTPLQPDPEGGAA